MLFDPMLQNFNISMNSVRSIKQTKIEIPKVYTIRLQRCRD